MAELDALSLFLCENVPNHGKPPQSKYSVFHAWLATNKMPTEIIRFFVTTQRTRRQKQGRKAVRKKRHTKLPIPIVHFCEQ